jgi:hypothetical protein
MVQTEIKAKVYLENERKYNQLTVLFVIQICLNSKDKLQKFNLY